MQIANPIHNDNPETLIKIQQIISVTANTGH